MTRQEMLEALGRIPDRFQSLVYGLTTDQLARRPKEDEWSIAEILNHLPRRDDAIGIDGDRVAGRKGEAARVPDDAVAAGQNITAQDVLIDDQVRWIEQHAALAAFRR